MTAFRVHVDEHLGVFVHKLSMIESPLDKLMRNRNENTKNGKKEIKFYKEQSKSSKVKIVIATQYRTIYCIMYLILK
jgi:hypothetical protein